MALIIKKGGAKLPPASRVVEAPRETPPPPAETSPPPAPTLPPQEQAKQSTDWWTKHGLPPDAKLKKCGFCGHMYYKPCTAEQSAKCINFGWFREQQAKKAQS